MGEIEQKLVQLGLDRPTARKVIEFLRQHADQVVAALQEDTLPSAYVDTIPGAGKPL